MEQSQLSIPNEETGLPKELKVIGILSLIWGGLMIIYYLFGIKAHYFPSESDKLAMEENMKKILTINPDADQVSMLIEKFSTNNIFLVIAEIVSVIGVVLMLKRKKTGFYMYLAAELLMIIATIVIVGVAGLMGPFAMLGEKFQGLGIGYVVAALVIDFVFIYLYSKHLKSML